MAMLIHTDVAPESSIAPTHVSHGGTRLDGVDILRGLAIVFVLMNHVNMRLFLAKIPYTRGLPSQLVSSLVWNGQFGVQIFFTVSGFLITSTSIRRWGSLSKVNVVEFYELRFARIAPLLLLLLGVLCTLHVAGLEDYVVSRNTGGLERALVAALTFHINVLEARRGYLPANWDVLWSLSVEEMFYLLFPPIARLFGPGKWLVALLMIVVALGPVGRAVLAQGNDVWREYSYLGGMDAIALGCLTAIATAKIAIPRDLVRVLSGIGIALLLLILGLSNQTATWGLGRTGLDMTIAAIGTCLVIAAAASTHWQSPRIFLPVLTLGRRSYEIYLTHMFVVFICFRAFMSAGHNLDTIPATFVSAIVLSAVLGEVIARLYSEPMNRRLRRYFGVVVQASAAQRGVS